MTPLVDRQDSPRVDAVPCLNDAASAVHDYHEPPSAPTSSCETGIPHEVLLNLALKLAYTTTRFSTQWAAQKLCLPLQIVADLLEPLRRDHLIEMLGEAGPFNRQFAITASGRERALQLMEVSRYVGPAPVSLKAYCEWLDRQLRHQPKPNPQQIAAALDAMTLPEEAIQVAGLAAQSRRSLFLYGPPGNGKTTLGHLLHQAVEGCLWIPHCIGIEHDIIRVFDPVCHEPATDELRQLPQSAERPVMAAVCDHRWVRIRNPFIVVGGELTIESLDLVYNQSVGYYEAPLHFKANGGTFLLDDFGCQRVAPDALLNRWIHPLERGIDFLTLRTGQQIDVPFRQMLIVSTNQDPEQVMTPAFLRRMGYRIYLGDPTPERFAEIFRKYAESRQLTVPAAFSEALLERYRAEGRAMRSCEPRDLIERMRDICQYHDRPLQLSAELLDVAWKGYFGNATADSTLETATAPPSYNAV